MARKRSRLHGSPEQHRAAAENNAVAAVAAFEDAAVLAADERCTLAVKSFGQGMAQAGIYETESSWARRSGRSTSSSSMPQGTQAATSIVWGPYEGQMTWDAAVKLAAAKGAGWRLPTVDELASQYDYTNQRPKRSDWSGDHWSSSPHFSMGAWSLNFDSDSGLVDANVKQNKFGVRLVYDASAASAGRAISSSQARQTADAEAKAMSMINRYCLRPSR